MSALQPGRELDLGVELLDRSVVAPDRSPLGKVDDLELREGPDGWPEVVALLLGSDALADRLGRRTGALLHWAARRCGGGGAPRRIPLDVVEDIGATITVGEAAARDASSPVEQRLRERVVGRIPGAGHAS